MLYNTEKYRSSTFIKERYDYCVKRIFKKEIITPGIRFNKNLNDQKRVMTPKQAFKNKVSGIVIGRSLTKGNIKNNTLKLIDHLNK